jgi:FKBP-type peptidyl-prolyl cis-trans isomerase SlpA
VFSGITRNCAPQIADAGFTALISRFTDVTRNVRTSLTLKCEMRDEHNKIGLGSKVRMHFSITLEDGHVAESTFDDEPVEITIGAGELEKGLELALIGLKPRDKQCLQLMPGQAFGYYNPQTVHTMSRREFSKDLKLEPGVIIAFTTSAGDTIPGLIRSVSDESVEVDFNHPLAGHTITFSTEVLAVTNA